MRRLWSSGFLVVIALVVCACSSRSGLNEYLEEIDEVDAEWQASTEAAFAGKEYLATGSEPPRGHTISDVVRDVDANTRDLLAATRSARDRATEIEPPNVAERFHSDYVSTLNQMIALWEDGLLLLQTPTAQAAMRGDPAAFEQFLTMYFSFQSNAAAVQSRMDEVARERNRLGD